MLFRKSGGAGIIRTTRRIQTVPSGGNLAYAMSGTFFKGESTTQLFLYSYSCKSNTHPNSNKDGSGNDTTRDTASGGPSSLDIASFRFVG